MKYAHWMSIAKFITCATIERRISHYNIGDCQEQISLQLNLFVNIYEIRPQMNECCFVNIYTCICNRIWAFCLICNRQRVEGWVEFRLYVFQFMNNCESNQISYALIVSGMYLICVQINVKWNPKCTINLMALWNWVRN